MDWHAEWVNSARWLFYAYSITLVVLAGAALAFTRLSTWGRQFRDLSGAYFTARWQTLAWLALILFLALFGVRMTVLFTMWFNTMYTSLQKLDEGLVALLATIDIIRQMVEYYIEQRFIIGWRQWLNDRLLGGWLEQQAYFRTQYLPENKDNPLENPEQRIQHDITAFAQSSMTLAMGMVKAIVSTMVYTLILWDLSGVLPLFGVDIPRGMVFTVFIYVLVATVFAVRIGRPLIALNYLNERFGADYRYALTRLREYAESIAFYRGEKVEGALLRQRFAQVITNTWAMVRRTLWLLGFNTAISQTASFLPFLVQSKRFFAKDITLGDLVQTSRVFGHLLNNLSFFRNAYDDFAAWRATLNRLHGFTRAIDDAAALPAPDVQSKGQCLALRDVQVCKPDGSVLINGMNLELAPGQTLLIRGPSGAGKTTLLRTIAGLWPYSQGEIIRPDQNTLFLSQQPYLPLGSLRAALHYPAAVRNGDDEAANILHAIQLGHLANRLDDVADWSRILSLGEQQQLAFGRLLLAKPAVAFLDEATSAMDEAREDTLYRLLRARLPHTTLISVGHRSTLRVHHEGEVVLAGKAGGNKRRPCAGASITLTHSMRGLQAA